MRRVRAFARDASGQDLIEYSLLLAFLCIAGAATFLTIAPAVSQIWTVVNERLKSASQ